MNGKELKEWAAKVSDDCIIEVADYSRWKTEFKIRARLELVFEASEEEGTAI